MSDRVNFISFHKAQLSRVRALEPAISVSYLTNGGEYSVGEEDFEKNVLDIIVPLNASLSPNWESMNADGVRRLARYGVKVNAWTMNMEAVFFRELKNIGYATYTTDFCGWLEKHPYKIVLQTTEIEVVEGVITVMKQVPKKKMQCSRWCRLPTGLSFQNITENLPQKQRGRENICCSMKGDSFLSFPGP